MTIQTVEINENKYSVAEQWRYENWWLTVIPKTIEFLFFLFFFGHQQASHHTHHKLYLWTILLINFSLVVSAVYYAKHFKLSAAKVMTQIIHSFLLRSTGKLKSIIYSRLREDGLWNTKPFRGILSLLEGCLPFWKGFSSKQTSVTLPILHPIKIYWTHVENTVPPISGTTSLSQTNKYSDHKDKKINKKNPFPAFWVHNQHLIRCNDLQYDKSGKIYCDRLNGAQHKYNYSSHDLLHLPPPEEVHTKTTKDTQPAVICFFNLLLDISWCQKNKIKSSKATKCWGFNGELRWSLLQQSHVVVFDLKQNLRVNVKAVTLNFLFRDQCV